VAPAFADDPTLESIAASAGAQSQNWTMCLAMVFLKTRRMVYWKVRPGDCGSRAYFIAPGATSIGAGILGSGASIDPEPVSKSILAGLAAIFGGFTAAHAAAVQREQDTLCEISTAYNQAIQQIEGAVAAGRLDAVNASSILDSIIQQLDPGLGAIAKPVNAAYGFRLALRALQIYNENYVFPGLAPVATVTIPGLVPVQVPSLAAFTPSPAPSPGAPSAPPLTGAVPTILPTSISLPSGSEGLILVGGGLIAARALGAI
jgi:hypothetical protein